MALGAPQITQDSRFGARDSYMVTTGVSYVLDPVTSTWGFALREATARKQLSPDAFTLGERRGAVLFYPYPHGVALVLLNSEEVTRRAAASHLGVDLASESRTHLESLVRAKWPEYFDGSVAPTPPKLKPGDTIEAVEDLGKGVPKGMQMEVTRVTPSMIWVDGFRIPQSFLHEGRIRKVGSLREGLIRLASSYPSGSEQRKAILKVLRDED